MICNRIDCLGLKCKGIGTGCAVTEEALRANNPKELKVSGPVFYGLDLSSTPDETIFIISRAKYINLDDDPDGIARRTAIVGGSDGDIILRSVGGAWADAIDAAKILKDIGAMETEL